MAATKTPRRSALSPRGSGPHSASVASGPERVFAAPDPNVIPPPKVWSPWLVTPLVVAALVIVAFVRSLIVRTMLPLVLAVVAVGLLVVRDRARRRAAPPPAPRRGLVIRGTKLYFRPIPSGFGTTAASGSPADLANGIPDDHLVLDLSEPFGATLLSTHRRDRLVLVLSSTNGIFHVGVTLDDAVLDSAETSVSALAPWWEHVTTVAGEDAALDAIGPDGEPVLLPQGEMSALLDTLRAMAPGCLDRVVLTDTRGAKVVLEEGALLVDSHAFDLNAPLEWRALVFQEPFGQVMTLYQGTWIRQGGSEVVLVSLMPSFGPLLEVEPNEIPLLDRAVLRDLRLMQASAENPPPRDRRYAIERLLMMPIRSSLDRAPRKSRQPPARPPLH